LNSRLLFNRCTCIWHRSPVQCVVV